MSPSDAYGIADLAALWGVSKVTAAQWTERPEFTPAVKWINRPAGADSGGQAYVDRAEVHAWMERRKADGLAVPGELGPGQRGPDRQPRKRRPAGGSESPRA